MLVPAREARCVWRRAVLIASPLLVLLGVLLSGARGASAHDWLVSSTPAAGQRLDAAPAVVTLVFSDDVLDLGDEVIVVDPRGHDWASGSPQIVGRRLSVPLTPELPPSAYQIRWRVVSADGHPVTGLISFTVGDAPAWVASPNVDGSPAVGIHVAGPARRGGTAGSVAIAGVGGAVIAGGGYVVVRYGRHRRARMATPDRDNHE